jgi:predicted TIM-barrel fold metal-dependent hydrolase
MRSVSHKPRIWVLALLLIALVGPHVSCRTRVEKPPIIDMHLHAFPVEWYGRPAPKWVPPGLIAAESDEFLMRETLAELERHNIIKAVASGSWQDVQKWKAASPDRIVAGIALEEPSLEVLELIEVEHKAGRLQVLGEALWQYSGLSPSDPKVEPYLALAERLDLPLGVHMGLSWPDMSHDPASQYRVGLGSPLLLEAALLRHPKLRIIIMHAGWPFLDDAVAMMHAYPQVYADLAVINWLVPRREFHLYLRRLVDAGFGKRLMFGSDQMVWPGAIALGIEGIVSADFLSEEQKRDIFYNNAARFLRLN